MEVFYLIIAVFFLIVSVLILALSSSYDINFRNIISITIGGTFGAVVGFHVWAYSVANQIVLFSASGSVLLASMIGGPVVGCVFGLKYLGEKNYYSRQRERN